MFLVNGLTFGNMDSHRDSATFARGDHQAAAAHHLQTFPDVVQGDVGRVFGGLEARAVILDEDLAAAVDFSGEHRDMDEFVALG